jgi:hypothetical protein
MFSPEERDHLRSDLLEFASRDGRITGAAITGSAAIGCQDGWSDVDLAFGVGNTAELHNVLSDWTERMYHKHSALHHVDIMAGDWVYGCFCFRALFRWILRLHVPQSFEHRRQRSD